MRTLVTGGAGFIGANLVRELLARGHHAVAYDNLSTGFRANLVDLDAELVVADILDFDRLVAATEGFDAIVHLAARASVPRSIADPRASHDNNVTGTLNVLEAARLNGVEHVISASSSSVYGSNPVLPKHEGLKPSPLSPYAAMKLATETYTLAWQHSMGLKTLAFRFFNVFGPLQAAGHAYAAVVPAFVDAALHERPIPMHGDGKQTRDFTYVGTVASVLTRAIEGQITSPEPLNLAFGTRTDLLHVVELIEDITGRQLEIEFQPSRPGDVRDSQADTTRLLTLFPDIDPVELRVGLEETVAWHQQRLTSTV